MLGLILLRAGEVRQHPPHLKLASRKVRSYYPSELKMFVQYLYPVSLLHFLIVFLRAVLNKKKRRRLLLHCSCRGMLGDISDLNCIREQDEVQTCPGKQPLM